LYGLHSDSDSVSDCQLGLRFHLSFSASHITHHTFDVAAVECLMWESSIFYLFHVIEPREF